MTSFLSARAREEEEVVGKWGQTEGRLRVGAKLTFEKGKSFPFEANQPNLFYDVRAAVILRTAVATSQLLCGRLLVLILGQSFTQ